MEKNSLSPSQAKIAADSELAFDFENYNAEPEQPDDEQDRLWAEYTQMCYSQNPPIPALSLMKPIIAGDEGSAIFPHQHISNHLPIILKMLIKSKRINELNLCDNSLTSMCVPALIEFVKDDESLSGLLLNDNPLIGSHGMLEFLDGIKESQVLETLAISNTGCGKIDGTAIASVLNGCKSLIKFDISNCALRQSAIEIVQQLPNVGKLKELNMAKNELHIGLRRFAIQLGTNVGKCQTLTRLNLSQNALTSEMCTAMMKGLADAPKLKHLDISRNNIGETAGRSIGIYISKAQRLKTIDISQNPLLNVTINKIHGQTKLEEDAKKPGGKKDKKPKVYTPGCYTILVGCSKSQTLVLIRMIGLVVDKNEWETKIQALHAARSNCEVEYSAPQNESFIFRRPQTAMPGSPPAVSARGNASGAQSARKTTRR